MIDYSQRGVNSGPALFMAAAGRYWRWAMPEL